ncbi:unnamed protein product [Pedinophyceae sp. YPF-701]|nr:unnamed protein product [Pedinophyceae sp. YPF-701]
MRGAQATSPCVRVCARSVVRSAPGRRVAGPSSGRVAPWLATGEPQHWRVDVQRAGALARFQEGGQGRPLYDEDASVQDRPSTAKLLAQVATVAASAITDPVMTLIDSAFVGHLGIAELAAMGPNCTLFNMVSAFASTALLAASVGLVGRSLGRIIPGTAAASLGSQDGDAAPADAADDDELPVGRAVATTVCAALCVGLLATGILISSPERWLRLAGADPAIMHHASAYLTIRAACIVPGMLAVAVKASYTAALDLKTPLRAILVAGAVNAVLDPLLIYGAGWGVAGAAVATVAAELAHLAALSHFLFGRDRKRFGLDAAPAALVPRRADMLPFLRDTAVLAVRAVNVIVVWAATSVAAAHMGVLHTAAHQVVLCFQQFQAIAMGAFTTVTTAVCARAVTTRGGEAAAVRAARPLMTAAAATAAALSAATWVVRGSMVSLVTSSGAVAAMASEATGPMCAMLALMWFKATEGALVGVGDASAMSGAFIPAAAACLLGVRETVAQGWGLPGLWGSLMMYYAVLAVVLQMRWSLRWAPAARKVPQAA